MCECVLARVLYAHFVLAGGVVVYVCVCVCVCDLCICACGLECLCKFDL